MRYQVSIFLQVNSSQCLYWFKVIPISCNASMQMVTRKTKRNKMEQSWSHNEVCPGTKNWLWQLKVGQQRLPFLTEFVSPGFSKGPLVLSGLCSIFLSEEKRSDFLDIIPSYPRVTKKELQTTRCKDIVFKKTPLQK